MVFNTHLPPPIFRQCTPQRCMWCNTHRGMAWMLPHCNGAWHTGWVFLVVQKFLHFFLSGDWFYTQHCQTISPAGDWSPGTTSSPPPCAACIRLALPAGWHLPQPQPGDSGQDLVAGNQCLQTHTLQWSTVFLTPHITCRTAATEEALVTIKASQPGKAKDAWCSISCWSRTHYSSLPYTQIEILHVIGVFIRSLALPPMTSQCLIV